MDQVELIKTVTEVAASIATFLGVPIAIFVFLREKRKERQEREDATYGELNQQYIMYLEKVMDNPHLGLYSGIDTRPADLSGPERIRQAALFEILVCMLEQAYLMYTRFPTDITKKQWGGWHDYTGDWCENPTFRELWTMLGSGSQYDPSFAAYVNTQIETGPKDGAAKA